MRLVDFARDHAAIRGCCPEYTRTLCRRALALCRFAGSTQLKAVLTERTVNDFLGSLTLGPWTIRSYRCDLLTIWRAAADQDLVPYPIGRRIRRIKCPELVVDCYSIDEVRALVAAAEIVPGALANGVAKRKYWPAAIRCGWDAGLRRGDIWRLRRDMIRPDGTLVVVQSKTGKRLTVQFRPSTIKALDRIGGQLPLAWTMNQWSFGLQFKRITQLAGVKPGSFKYLRRASGSYVELTLPGAGSKHLGHSSPEVFDRHYRCALGGPVAFQPPALD